MRTLIVATLLAAPMLSAGAQTLHRCVERGKPTTVQSSPCSTTARTALYAPAARELTDGYAPASFIAPTSMPQHGQHSSSSRARVTSRASRSFACLVTRLRHAIMVSSHTNEAGRLDGSRVLGDAVETACH